MQRRHHPHHHPSSHTLHLATKVSLKASLLQLQQILTQKEPILAQLFQPESLLEFKLTHQNHLQLSIEIVTIVDAA